jgi:hypothetical protein
MSLLLEQGKLISFFNCMSVNKLLVVIGKLIDFILRCPLNLWIIWKFILEVVNWIRVFFKEIQNYAEWTERFIRCIVSGCTQNRLLFYSFLLLKISRAQIQATYTKSMLELTRNLSHVCGYVSRPIVWLHMWAGHGISESNDCTTEKLHVGAPPKCRKQSRSIEHESNQSHLMKYTAWLSWQWYA